MIGTMKQIQLVKYGTSQGSEGQWEQTPVTYNAWADISRPSGFRVYDHMTMLGETRVFKVRFRFDIWPGADWKVRYLGRDWTLTSPPARVDEKKFWWEFTATTKANVQS